MSRSFVLEPLDDTLAVTGPIRLSRFPCTIGRSRDCEPRLNLHRISRRHLRLSVEQNRLLVEDLGSTNGTFVNDERVSSPTTLRPGDSLHIADYAFRVAEAEQSGTPGARLGGEPGTLAGQTIAGFTEDPDGFPVQAPQLYELLNDFLLEPMAVEVRVEDGPSDALLVFGRSKHARLAAGHDRLSRMARQLGEEARYHGILRELAMEAADNAGLDSRLIILPVDALEVEDAAVLLHELSELTKRFRRLRLGCHINPSELDPITLKQLRKSLKASSIELTARAESDEEEQACRKAGVTILEMTNEVAAKPLEDYF